MEQFDDEDNFEGPELLPATLIGNHEARRPKEKEKEERWKKSKLTKKAPLNFSKSNHKETDIGPSHFESIESEIWDQDDAVLHDDSLIAPNAISEPSPGAYAVNSNFCDEADEDNAWESNWNLNVASDASPPASRNDPETDGILIEANLVEEHNIPSAEAVSESFLRRRRLLIICILLVGIVSFVLSIVLTRNNGGSNNTSSFPSFVPSVAPSSSPTSSVRQTIEEFSPESIPAFENKDSPQYRALDWAVGDYQTIESTDQIIQRYALATLIFSTGGKEQWANSTGWLSDQSECTWFTSSDDQESICRRTPGTLSSRSFESFVKLELKDMRLSGSIPPEVRLLSNLELIDLSRNPMDGEIPSEIGLLTKVSRLDFTRGGFEGSIPTEIGLLSSRLTTMYFSDNLLDGNIPSEIGNLGNLQYFHVSGNSLSGRIPTDMGLLSHLVTARLNDNKLQGQIPSQLGLLNGIEGLYLGQNFLSGSLPFGNFTSRTTFLSLHALSLEDNTLTGSIGTEIGLLPNIASLSLRQSGLSGSLPSELGMLSSLEAIDLSKNEISGFIPSEIGLMTSLAIFQLIGTRVSGAIPTEIGQVWSLEELSLSENKLKGKIISELGLLVNLEKLSIQNEEEIGGSIPSEIGLMRNLDQLSLSFNALSGAIPTQIGMLTYLQAFRARKNRLSGRIPTEIGLLIGLKDIQLGFNKDLQSNTGGLSGSLPSEVGRLQALQELNVERNNLEGRLGTEIGLMRNLRKLVLNSNELVGNLPSELGLLRRIEDLDIGDNNLQGSLPTEISLMQSIEDINLRSNMLSGTIPIEYGSLRRLQNLELEDNDLVGSVPGSICQLRSGRLGANSLSIDCAEVDCSCCSDFCGIKCESDDDHYVQVAVSTNEFPEDIVWELTDETDQILLVGGPYNDSDIRKTILTATCISRDICASFSITGSGEDKSDTPQSYDLSVNGDPMHQGIVSEVGKSLQIGNCAPTIAPTLALLECNTNSTPFRLQLSGFDPDATAWQVLDSTGNTVIDVGFGEVRTGVFQDCLPVGSCFTFNIFDYYGDGICCSREEGSYSLYWDGKLVTEGGEFGLKETSTIGTCINPNKTTAPLPIECEGETKSIRIHISTDLLPQETSWMLVNMTTGTAIAEGGPYKDDERLRNFTTERCFDDNDCLKFTIYDSYGDGMQEPGSYAIYVDEQEVSAGRDFGKSESVRIGNNCIDTGAPTVPPTRLPTESPTTQAPTGSSAGTPTTESPATQSPTAETPDAPTNSSEKPTGSPSVSLDIEGSTAPLVPSTLLCNGEELLFRLEITTDDHPEDTSWVLQNAKTGISILKPEESYSDTATKFVHEMCVENDLCLLLFLYDNGGNGLEEPGGYAAYLDGEEIGVGHAFGFAKSFQFGQACPPERNGRA